MSPPPESHRRWTVLTQEPVGAQRSWLWFDNPEAALEQADSEGGRVLTDPGDGSLHTWVNGQQAEQLWPAP